MWLRVDWGQVGENEEVEGAVSEWLDAGETSCRPFPVVRL